MGSAARNEHYYDKAYASSNLIKPLIKLYLSYDQLSKTRRNLAAIKNDLKSPHLCRYSIMALDTERFYIGFPRSMKFLAVSCLQRRFETSGDCSLFCAGILHCFVRMSFCCQLMKRNTILYAAPMCWSMSKVT